METEITKKRILVLDDDQGVLDVIRIRLEDSGYGVQCAHDGQEALSILETEGTDLIITDIIIPDGMDGFQFFKMLKETETYSKIPVIVLTGRPAMKSTFEMLGADGFLAKPFSGEILVEAVTEQLSQTALIAGNVEGITDAMKRLLKKDKYEAEIVAYADRIEELIKNNKYAIILLQVELFDSNAPLPCVQLIRQSEKNRRTPVILYTKQKALALGTSDASFLFEKLREGAQKIESCDLIDTEFSKSVFIGHLQKFKRNK